MDALSPDELAEFNKAQLTPLSDDELKEFQGAQKATDDKKNADVLPDVGHSFASGVVRGTAGLPGIAGDVRDLGRVAHDYWYQNRPDVEKWTTADHSGDLLPNTEDILGHADSLLPGTKEFADYKPQTTAGKFANVIGGFIPGAVLPGVASGVRAGKTATEIATGALTDAARYGVTPGVLSEGAGQTAEAMGMDPAVATGARVVGGLLGPVAGKAYTGPVTTTSGLANNTNDVRNAAVDFLRERGNEPDPGQASGKKYLSYLYDELNPERYQDQRDAFTKSAMDAGVGQRTLATAGGDGTLAAMRDHGNGLYEAAIRDTPDMPLDHAMANSAVDRLEYINRPGKFKPDEVNAMSGAIQRVVEMADANGGAIPARDYQALRSDIVEDVRGTQDPRVKEQLQGIVSDLDSNMERHLTNTQGPEAASRFRDANDYWKRYSTLKDAADPKSGQITPAALEREAENHYGETSALEHTNPFSELAQKGKLVLGEAKSSGTAEREATRRIMGSLPAAAVGYGADYLLNGSGEHLATTLALENMLQSMGTSAAKPVLRGLLDNAPVRRAVSNVAQSDGSKPIRSAIPGLLQDDDKRRLSVTVHKQPGVY